MTKTPKTIDDLTTPCLLLDYDVMMKNLTQVHRFIHENGKKIRAHVKAHKCSRIARLQIENGAEGLCTANLSEAVELFSKGFDNILITRPIVEENKIRDVVELAGKGKNIIVVADNEDVINIFDNMDSKNSRRLNVLLDINVGFGRTGFSTEQVLNIAERVKSKNNIVIRGIQAYAGHVQHIQNYNERTAQSLECMNLAAGIFRELRNRGLECDIFSGGGTGTYSIDVSLEELTELQIGSYVLMDAQYLEVGFNNERSAIDLQSSLSVMSTVISTNQIDYVTVDAGLKSIYRDSPNPVVLGERGNECSYDWFGDEFGKIIFNNVEHKFKLGEKVFIQPSHCDPTVNLFDKYYVISGNKVIADFPIDLRGCSQ